MPQAGDFDLFSESLYRYGEAAGMFFAARHGGPFATPAIARLVEAIRELGIRGTGQSSWGPTVFALAADETSADEFIANIRDRQGIEMADHEIILSRPDRCGAVVETE